MPVDLAGALNKGCLFQFVFRQHPEPLSPNRPAAQLLASGTDRGSFAEIRL